MCCGKKISFWKILAGAAALLLVAYILTLGFGGSDEGESHDGFTAEPGYEWPPDTVVAQVNGYQITQADFNRRLDAEIEGHAEGQTVNEYALLKMMLRSRLLYEKAKKHGIQDTATFAEIYEWIKGSERAEWMPEDELRRNAMSKAYLMEVVIGSLDIKEEQLEKMYMQYKSSMPEGTEFQDVREILLNELRGQHVERHVGHLFEDAELSINENWAQQKQREAQETQSQCSVSGCPNC